MEPLTDLHMVVLQVFADEAANSLAAVAAVLGVPPDVIGSLVADLEAAGLIEAVTVH